MTPAERHRHIDHVRELSKPGGPLDKDSAHATINNPAWFRPDGTPRAARRAVHRTVTARVLAAAGEVHREARALVLAGPPGAGKGRIAADVLGDQLRHYVNVDADEFKRLLLETAIADGSYDTWIKPEAIRELERDGDTFYPLELASLVHEESSLLAVQLREDLIESQANIIVDTVLGNRESALRLGRQLSDAGYEVTLVDVEVPFDVSEVRIKQRWELAMQEAGAGIQPALGGRWVPSAYARPLFNTSHGRSKSQDVAAHLADDCPAVIRYERYFTSAEEHAAANTESRPASPRLELAKRRDRPGGLPRVTVDKRNGHTTDSESQLMQTILAASFPLPASKAIEPGPEARSERPTPRDRGHAKQNDELGR